MRCLSDTHSPSLFQLFITPSYTIPSAFTLLSLSSLSLISISVMVFSFLSHSVPRRQRWGYRNAVHLIHSTMSLHKLAKRSI